MLKYVAKAWLRFFVVYLFGWLGVHKFFIEKKNKIGFLYLFTFGLLAVGWLFDCLKYLFKAIKSPFTFKKIKKTIAAAELGQAKAQCDLGIMYIDGKGIKKNYLEGIFWLEKSAEQGWAPATYNLAMLHRYGIGVNKNIHNAISWYEKAYQQGLVVAANDIGDIYYYGAGVDSDIPNALKWLAIAANEGYKPAFSHLQERGLFTEYYDQYATEAVKKEYTPSGTPRSSGYDFTRDSSKPEESDPFDEWMRARNVTVFDRHGNPLAWNLTLEEAERMGAVEHEDPYT